MSVTIIGVIGRIVGADQSRFQLHAFHGGHVRRSRHWIFQEAGLKSRLRGVAFSLNRHTPSLTEQSAFAYGSLPRQDGNVIWVGHKQLESPTRRHSTHRPRCCRAANLVYAAFGALLFSGCFAASANGHPKKQHWGYAAS